MPTSNASSLPSNILDHVYSEALEEWYGQFTTTERFLDIDREAIDDAVWKVYTRESTIDAFLKALEEVFGSSDRARAIAIPILGNDFLKIEDYLGIDIAAYIRSIGGDPTQFVEEVPVESVIENILEELGVAQADPVLTKRLQGAAQSYLLGVRDALETRGVLERGMKVGGIGLDTSEAERIVRALEERKRALQAKGVKVLDGAHSRTHDTSFRVVRPSAGSLIRPEDEEEIAALRTQTPSATMTEGVRALVARVIAKTGAKFKRPESEQRFRMILESRMRDVRDARETLETLVRPYAQGGLGIPEAQAKKVLAVAETEASQLHGYESERTRVRKNMSTGERKGERLSPSPVPTTPVVPRQAGGSPHVPTAALSQPTKQTPTAKANASTFLSAPVPRAIVPPPPPVVGLRSMLPNDLQHVSRPEPSTTTIPVERASPKVPFPPVSSLPQKVSPVTPPTKAPVETRIASSPSSGSAPSLMTKSIPVVKPPPKLEAANVNARPQRFVPKAQATAPLAPALPTREIPVAKSQDERKLSGQEGELARGRAESGSDVSKRSPAPSVKQGSPVFTSPHVSSAKPKLQDIRPAPMRLVGPIEELRRLTIADFRKIGSTSGAAAAAIAQKLDLLERDSYTKRAEGVKALRTSPLMARYAELLNAALTGKRKVEDLIEERRKQDREALSKEEFDALVSLNTKLRF